VLSGVTRGCAIWAIGAKNCPIALGDPQIDPQAISRLCCRWPILQLYALALLRPDAERYPPEVKEEIRPAAIRHVMKPKSRFDLPTWSHIAATARPSKTSLGSFASRQLYSCAATVFQGAMTTILFLWTAKCPAIGNGTIAFLQQPNYVDAISPGDRSTRATCVALHAPCPRAVAIPSAATAPNDAAPLACSSAMIGAISAARTAPFGKIWAVPELTPSTGINPNNGY
jgi:hypothetical protein